MPAHQAPSSWSKGWNFGFIACFTHAKVYLISGLLCFFWFWPTNASGAGQYISHVTTILCIWSLQNPRRSPSFSLNITSQLRLKWQECWRILLVNNRCLVETLIIFLVQKAAASYVIIPLSFPPCWLCVFVIYLRAGKHPQPCRKWMSAIVFGGGYINV